MSYKKWIIAATLLFVIGLVFSFASPTNFVSEEIGTLKDLGATLSSLPPVFTAIFIFVKNTSALLFSFALSPVLCLVPILALTFNAYVIAAVSVTAAEQESIGFVLAALLPHGVLEIPALIMGEAAALSFGAAVTLSLFRKEYRSQLLPNLKQNAKYLMVAIGLLIPAAIIEAFVTPLLIN